MKILLSRTDRIGDLVLSTPAIATVRASFPQARITLVASAHNRVVVERNHDVDEVVVLPRGASPRTFGARFRGYDMAVALAPRMADVQLVGNTRAPVRVGYTYERRWIARLSLRLYVNRFMVSEADPELCDREITRRVRHEVVQLLDLVALAGADRRVESLRLHVTDADRRINANLPEDPIVLHLGQRWFSGGSTLQGTLAIVDGLARIAPIVVTCPRDSEIHASHFEQRPSVAKLLRRLEFHQWAAVLERARAVVTVDTGATHVASAVHSPTVVAFEHRYFALNSQEWSPYRVPHVCVRKPAGEDQESLAAFRRDIVGAVVELVG
ncbi:MAG: glycosyltransferase family 9 protein [Candidatus Eremiobacteraeota bacterium]|nr:glycosyltransferase family 9 protein [Candidatus Eremiobacteraeota bacterium]MBV9055677.1 glycosyltransferase family 9 protein [Candidatus Eremiobacteraeota bacterium]MBV9698911.1 glycosyltransferase family 9 protein [Candidatus Eremiobacteraeota bacterium]